MTLRITEPMRQAMIAQAEEAYPAEACGLIVGHWQAETALGVRYHRCHNRRRSERERRFLIDPEAYLQLEDQAEAEGLDIVGIVHTHPDHPDRPSEFDRRHAWPGLSYLIIAVAEGRNAGYRAWRLRADRSGFEAEPILLY